MDKISLSAERIVGYQTNLLRCLLSDEISSVLVQSKKLVGSRHPLLKTARNFIYDRDEGLNSIGLIVLLISRSAENLIRGFEPSPLGQNHVSGVQEKQRKLAEVAEMINTGYAIHLGMVNSSQFRSSDDIKTMNFGNKITVLSGDFFLAKASVGLSELENSKVVEIMAEILSDIVEGETMKDYKRLNETSLHDMNHLIFKSSGSLLAKSCLCSLMLCQVPKKQQDAAFQFGKNLAFLQQIRKDYEEINTKLEHILLQNIFIVQNKHLLPSNVQENPLNTIITIDSSIHRDNMDIKGVLKHAHDCGAAALDGLEQFPQSEAKSCLQNFVQHLMLLKYKQYILVVIAQFTFKQNTTFKYLVKLMTKCQREIIQLVQ